MTGAMRGYILVVDTVNRRVGRVIMYGMFAIMESVTQLRGEAGERQLPDLELSMTHAPAGMFSGTSTLILGNQ